MSRFASPFDAMMAVLPARRSMMPIPCSISDLAIVNCGTPSKMLRRSFSESLFRASVVPSPKSISDDYTAVLKSDSE
jgi:hypothetical protein